MVAKFQWVRRFTALTVVAAAVCVALSATDGSALPRMTLMAGSRCSNCHVNPQGSGIRTEFGFYSMAQNGATTWDKLGWQKFHDLSDNRVMDGRITLGMDLRGQMAKFRVPRWVEVEGQQVQVDPERNVFPMQQNFGASVQISETLSAAASLNIAHLFKNYKGQSLFDGWLRFAPDLELPSIRVGMLQPSLGIRHDDHTILLRRNPFQPAQPLLAPNWNELGAEISYEGMHWLSVEVGAFTAKNLSLSCADSVKPDDLSVKPDDLIASGRLTLWPQSLDYGINSWIGGSFLKAGEMTVIGGHVGLGKTYWGTLIGEFTMSKTVKQREIMSMLVHAAYPIYDWLVAEARYEVSNGSKLVSAKTEEMQMTSWVAGLQFMPLSNIELRPEYRMLKTKDWMIGQWALQLHVWF